jgi:hypothetical protein
MRLIPRKLPCHGSPYESIFLCNTVVEERHPRRMALSNECAKLKSPLEIDADEVADKRLVLRLFFWFLVCMHEETFSVHHPSESLF